MRSFKSLVLCCLAFAHINPSSSFSNGWSTRNSLKSQLNSYHQLGGSLVSLQEKSSFSSSVSTKSTESAEDISSHRSTVITAITFVATTAWTSFYPLSALAAEKQVDNYEYGAVNAPIAIPLVGGLLAILTALIPVLFKGGEQAFEEMKARDEDTFGKSSSSVLDRNKKK